MRAYRYFLALFTLLYGMVARGQDFNPTTPAEPNAAYRLVLASDPAGAATLSGGGTYTVNKRITVRATATDPKWEFVNWTNSAGEVVNTNLSFTYTTTNKPELLTAHFKEVKIAGLTLSTSPATAGSVSGEGTYREGQTVNVRTSGNRNFVFQSWKDDQGNVVSTSSSFNYLFAGEQTHLTAYYVYSPGVPAEPSQTLAKHKVFLESTPCSGSFSRSSGFQVDEGASYSVTAYNVHNFAFKAWQIDGKTVETNATYTGTMQQSDVRLTALYQYQPGTPAEPNHANGSQATLFGMSSHVYRGLTALYPLYLENSASISSLTFTLALPAGLTADVDAIQGTARTYGYAVSSTSVSQNDSTYLTLTLSGGTQITGQNGKILDIPLTVGNTIPDGDIMLSLSDGTATLAEDGTVIDITTRSALLTVETLEESDIQASFNVDRMMNRAQFTNLSSDNALTFHWDFGDGESSTDASPMHVYAAPGTYTVRLTARGIINENKAEQVIVINSPSSWVAEGDYTIHPNEQGLRNFTSVSEMVDLLSQCTLGDNVRILLEEKSVHQLPFSPSVLALVQKLAESQGSLTFAGEGATLNVLLPDLSYAALFIVKMKTDGVRIQLNGATLNTALLSTFQTTQTICSGETTQLMPFASIGEADEEGINRITTTWTIAAPATVTGYESEGQGDLPAMVLTNSGSKDEQLKVEATVRLDGEILYTIPCVITVRPLLQNQQLSYSNPANGARVNAGNITLRWSNLNGLALGYTIHIEGQKNGEALPTIDEELQTNTYVLNAQAGASYQWYVNAHGTCDDLLGETQTFQVNEQANLVVSAITAPESGKGTNAATVTATITNKGQSATLQTGWYDAIYWSAQPDAYNTATLLTTVWHSGRLEAGDSYTATFNVTLPDATNEQIYFYVRTDSNNSESEGDETDNVSQSDATQLIFNYINEQDYAALKLLFQATNGEMWTTKWNILRGTITTNNWKGVTFDEEGNVTAINLNGNNLSGDLPADFAMSNLQSLTLSNNKLTGDAAAFTAGCPVLKTLNLSGNLLTDLSAPLSQTITSLNLNNQQTSVAISSLPRQVWPIAHGIEVNLTRIMQYDHQAQAFTAHPRLTLYTISGGSYMGYLEYDGMAYQLICNGDYRQSSGSEMRAAVDGGVTSGSLLRGAMTWITGDANTDGWVDVLDAQHTINRILERHSGNFNYYAADTYHDSNVNVQDLVATVNLFITADNPATVKSQMREGNTEASAADRQNDADMDEEGYADNSACAILTLTDGILWINCEQPVAAIDVTFHGITSRQVASLLQASRFQFITHNTSDGVRVVIVSPYGYELPAGENRLMRVSGEAEVTAAMLSDTDAHEVAVSILCEGNQTDALSAVSANTSAGSVYDMQGRRQTRTDARLPKGIYIKDGRKTVIR